MSRRGSTFIRRSVQSFPIAFLGDSLVAGWERDDEGKSVWDDHFECIHAGNYGTTGESTLSLYERLLKFREINLDFTRAAVLMVGSTDLMHKLKPEVVHEQLRKIIQILQEQKSGIRILVMGILPRYDCSQEILENIRLTNELNSRVENGFTIAWLDLWNHFYTKDETKRKELFQKDGYHLTTRGYELWAQQMQPIFEAVAELES